MSDPREVSVLASLADQYALAADPPYSFAFRDLAIALRDLSEEVRVLRARLPLRAAIDHARSRRPT